MAILCFCIGYVSEPKSLEDLLLKLEPNYPFKRDIAEPYVIGDSRLVEIIGPEFLEEREKAFIELQESLQGAILRMSEQARDLKPLHAIQACPGMIRVIVSSM